MRHIETKLRWVTFLSGQGRLAVRTVLKRNTTRFTVQVAAQEDTKYPTRQHKPLLVALEYEPRSPLLFVPR
jgi:hypothetical protein